MKSKTRANLRAAVEALETARDHLAWAFHGESRPKLFAPMAEELLATAQQLARLQKLLAAPTKRRAA
jgi:hypothetical protein